MTDRPVAGCTDASTDAAAPRRRFRDELGRKAIHLSSSLTPVVYMFTDRALVLELLIPVAALILLLDVVRQHPRLRAFYDRHWGRLMRSDELGRLCGASHVMLAQVISVLLFPRWVAIAVLLFLAISDSLASLAGMRIGGPRWHNASLAGSGAFLVSAVVIGLLCLPGQPLIGVSGALVATVVEALPLRVGRSRVDDNLTVPLCAGLVMWALRGWQ